MNEVRKTHRESQVTYTYVAPRAKVVHFQSEGVVCASIMTIYNESFTLEGTYEI